MTKSQLFDDLSRDVISVNPARIKMIISSYEKGAVIVIEPGRNDPVLVIIEIGKRFPGSVRIGAVQNFESGMFDSNADSHNTLMIGLPQENVSRVGHFARQ